MHSLSIHTQQLSLLSPFLTHFLPAGATKGVITLHFALTNNVADLAAKEGTQETLVTLLGLSLSLSLHSFNSLSSCPSSSLPSFLPPSFRHHFWPIFS
jgi:hypothetical protein